MASEAEAQPEETKKGTSIFRDVFRRADKNDDGALSWEEFTTFFSDGILSTADLEKLFHEIDTHNTNNLDTGELCDYFMKHIGPFSEVFAGLEEMNKAVSNALVQSAKDYSSSSLVEKFATRFLLKETLSQMNSLQYHIDVAVDKTDEQEMENRSPVPQAAMTVTGIQEESTENIVKTALSREVDRLASMVDRLESKVKFDVFEEEDADSSNDETVILVSRKFFITWTKNRDSNFRESLKAYIGYTSITYGCLHLLARHYSESSKVMLYEVWDNKYAMYSHLSSDASRQFMRENVDNLAQPEEYKKMKVPASWWKGKTV